MQIDIDPLSETLLVSHKEQVLRWPYKAWSKFNNVPTESAFGPVNKYIATFPEARQDYLFNLYVEASHVLDGMEGYQALGKALNPYIVRITNEFSFKDIFAWAPDNAVLDMPEPTTETVNRSYQKDSTYTEPEIYDLMVMSLTIKAVAPILGTFMTMINKEVGTDFKELISLDLLDGSSMLRERPWGKLRAYARALAGHKKIATLAIDKGMAYSQLDKYALSMLIMRRLTIAVISTGEPRSIVKYMYTFLTSSLAAAAKTSYRDKSTSRDRDGDSDESVADKYRIPEEVPMSIPIMSECYFDRLDLVCRDIQWDVSVEQLRTTRDMLLSNPEFEPADIHLTLVAFVTYKLEHAHSLELLNHNAIVTLIALTHEIFKIRGVNGLAQLMISVRKDKDPSIMDMSMAGGRVFIKLSNETANRLAEVYAKTTLAGGSAKTSNSGYVAIEEMVTEEMLPYDWVGFDGFENFREEVASLLIQGFNF